MRCIWLIDPELDRCYEIVRTSANLPTDASVLGWVALANIMLVLVSVVAMVGIVYGMRDGREGRSLALAAGGGLLVLGTLLSSGRGPDLVVALITLARAGD